jgi:hypothetical protein
MAAETNKVERTKQRKQRVPSIKLTDDANKNTMLVAENALQFARLAYKKLMRICNGRMVRGTKEKGNYQEFPLEPMSDARRKYYEDAFAALHDAAFSALEHRKRAEPVSVNVPR